MNEIITAFFGELLKQWHGDIAFIERNMWMIYTVIPGMFYFAFFMVKFAALTAPLWLPFALVLNRGNFITIKRK